MKFKDLPDGSRFIFKDKQTIYRKQAYCGQLGYLSVSKKNVLWKCVDNPDIEVYRVTLTNS